MRIIYNLSISIYNYLLKIASFLHPKAKLWIDGRKNIFKKLKKQIEGQKEIVWFHCASLGEFEQGRPIIEGYKKKYPDHKILLTFFSSSGFEVKKNYKLVNWVFYLPSDTEGNAKQFIDIVRPINVFFIKYEFWFNYMSELRKKEIPFYSLSSLFRKENLFFKYEWFAKQLTNVTHFFVQDKSSALLLQSIGYTNTTVSGDSRFDSVIENTKNPLNIPLIKTFSSLRTTIVCGSTWPKDEKFLLKYIKENPQYNYIIAPHEMRKKYHIEHQVNSLLLSSANNKKILTANVLIIDSIGILSSIYQYGDIAYIGGGFGNGIHNILEASTFGLPVIFGPNYQKFNEAIALINLKAAVSISNHQELTAAFIFFNNFDSNIATNYIKANCGATNKILDNI